MYMWPHMYLQVHECTNYMYMCNVHEEMILYFILLIYFSAILRVRVIPVQ